MIPARIAFLLLALLLVPRPAPLAAQQPSTPASEDIFTAAAAGNIERVEELLDLGININAIQNGTKDTPLLTALKNNQADLANVLLDRGADPNLRDRFKGTCLQWAVHWGHAPLAQRLIDLGANVNNVNSEGRAPIHYAIRRHHIEAVKVLIDNRANINLTSGFGHAPIDLALARPNPDIAMLLVQSGVRLADTPQNALARITIAAQNNWIPMVDAVLNQAKGDRALTQHLVDAAFDAALGPNHEELLVSLTSRDTGVSARTGVGFTRLFQACATGNEPLVRSLLDKGAEVNETLEPSGWTALHAAAFDGHANLVTLLLARGADPNIRDGLGRTPLHLAAASQRATVVNPLIKNKADPNARDFNGASPLHYAAARGYRNIANLLLRAGASVALADNDGMTPYMSAHNNAHTNLAEILKDPNRTEPSLPEGFDSLVRAAAPHPSDAGIDHARQKLLPAVRAGAPLIHVAAMTGRKAALDDVLAATPSAAVERDAYGYLPLHIAAQIGDPESLAALLDRTPDVNDAANLPKWTPLHFAAASGRDAAVRQLLQKRANANAKDALGRTPADVARLAGHPETAQSIH